MSKKSKKSGNKRKPKKGTHKQRLTYRHIMTAADKIKAELDKDDDDFYCKGFGEDDGKEQTNE
jgi:hypothetical protein